MPVDERASGAALSLTIHFPGENAVISIVLAVFLALHILAGAILQMAGPFAAAAMQDIPRASSYD
jgi:hypothetical protein